MANMEKEVVRLMAQEIISAIKKVNENNNKNYVDAQLKNVKVTGTIGGSSSSSGGTITGDTISASQVIDLYSTVAGFISRAPANSNLGDVDAGKIVSTITGLASLEIQSATIDTAQIENLYASYGEFINMVAKNAEIENLDVEQVRADIAEMGLANIGSADIGWAQIKDLVTNTAIIREGVGGKLYIDRLAVTDAQILSLTTGELIIQGSDGKLYTVYVDENGNVQTELRVVTGTDIGGGTIQGENIAENTITGALITEHGITARELNVSQIFADEALIKAIKAANLDVDDLFANEAFINVLTTSIIKSPSIGKDIDISNNSSIVLTDKKIGLVVSSESTETELVLTDQMMEVIADQVQVSADTIDFSANKSITAVVQREVAGIADTIIVGQEPQQPVIDMVWLDTSVDPNVFKRWNGTDWELIGDVADLTSRMDSAELAIDANTASIQSSAKSIDSLNTRVQSAEEKITPEAITQTVRDSQGYKDDIASATMTSEKFETFVQNSQGISDMEMTAEKFETYVENSQGIADMEMTAEKFETYVENSEGISKLEMTPEKFETFVEGSEGISSISQKADEIDFVLENGSSSTDVRFTPVAIDAISRKINLKANDEFNLVIGDLETIIRANSEGITMITGQVKELESGAQIFRRDSFPTTEDKVRPNDLLVMPTSGRTYQATEMKDANIQFYLGSDGALYYSISDEYGNYTVEMQGYDLYSVGFTLSYNEDGTVGVPFVWELVRDLELQEQIANHAETMAEAVVSINNDIANLQDQIDGNITTWFYAYVPTSSNLPASGWTTDKEKNNHLGDLFYVENTDLAQNGYCYRWQSTSSGYGWSLIKDTDVTKALSDAARAQDTADNKRRVFVSQPTPPYDIGDIWTQGSGGDILRCQTSRASGSYNSADWVKASKYTDDTAANNAQSTANTAQTAANNAQSTANAAQSAANKAQASADNLDRLTDIEVIEGAFAQTTRREGEGIHIYSEFIPKQNTSGDEPSPSSPYPIGGWTGLNAVACGGKNFCPTERLELIHWAVKSTEILSVLNSLSAGTYTFSAKWKLTHTATDIGTMASTDLYGISFYCGDDNLARTQYEWGTTSIGAVVENSWSFTVKDEHVGKFTSAYMYGVGNNQVGATGYATIYNIQIESGSATTYVPYSGNTYALQFGETIYGGSVDWNAGEMTVKWTCVSLTANNVWNYTTSEGNELFYLSDFTNQSSIYGHGSTGFMCSHYPISTELWNREESRNKVVTTSDNTFQPGFAFIQGTYGSLSAWKSKVTEYANSGNPLQLAFPVKTPYTIRLSPVQITTLKGLNTVYTDANSGRVEFGHDPIDVCDSTVAPENPKTGKLWLDRSVTPCVLRRWSGSEWETVNDVALIETVQDALLTKQAELEAAQRETALFLKLDSANKVVRIGQTGVTSEYRIDAFGSGVVVNNEIFSRFEANRVLFGNMEMRRPAVGGLAFDSIVT